MRLFTQLITVPDQSSQQSNAYYQHASSAAQYASSSVEADAEDQNLAVDGAAHIDGLTIRQHQVMDKVLAGHPSKNIVADLHISQRTVENNRASIMKNPEQSRSPNLPALRLRLLAPY